MIPASIDFINALKAPIKKMFIKLEFYDSSMRFINEFTKQVSKDDIGSVSVDMDRPIRRTFSFTLDNSKGEFLFGEEKLIWLDKRIKLFTGLQLSNGNVEYVPQGIYILTEPSDSHNRDGKKVTITGQDKAYMYTDDRGKFTTNVIIEEGANIVDAIKIIANRETMFNFDNITKTVPYQLEFNVLDNRWDAMQKLAELAQCLLYYDINGYLRLKEIDLNELTQYSPVWTYSYNSPTEKFYAGNSRRLDNIANHILVLGGSSQTATCSYELIVTESNALWQDSPYSIERIGDVVYGHNNGSPDPLLTTDEECKWRAKWELMKRLGYSERVSLSIAPNWLHEASDIIEVIDEESTLSGNYIISSFRLPLKPDIMQIECYKHRKIIDDWNFI